MAASFPVEATQIWNFIISKSLTWSAKRQSIDRKGIGEILDGLIKKEDENKHLRNKNQNDSSSIMVCSDIGHLTNISVEERLTQQKKVEDLLAAKYNSDIRHSLCHDKNYIQNKTKQILNDLEILKKYNRGDEQFASISNRWGNDNLKLRGETLTDSLSALSTQGKISIASTSIVVSACAASQSLKNRCYREFDLEFTCNYQNGVKLIESLKCIDPPDFLISPIDPFSFADKAITKDYRFLIPISTEFQYLFLKKGGDRYRYRCLNVYKNSSAHFHCELGIGIPRNVSEHHFKDINFWTNPIEKISVGDYVIAWDPLANIFKSSNEFDMIPGSTHEIIFCLFCHKRWCSHENLDHFVRLFMNELKYCANNIIPTTEYLKKNNSFMSSFADGAGLVWTPEF